MVPIMAEIHILNQQDLDGTNIGTYIDAAMSARRDKDAAQSSPLTSPTNETHVIVETHSQLHKVLDDDDSRYTSVNPQCRSCAGNLTKTKCMVVPTTNRLSVESETKSCDFKPRRGRLAFLSSYGLLETDSRWFSNNIYG